MFIRVPKFIPRGAAAAEQEPLLDAIKSRRDWDDEFSDDEEMDGE